MRNLRRAAAAAVMAAAVVGCASDYNDVLGPPVPTTAPTTSTTTGTGTGTGTGAPSGATGSESVPSTAAPVTAPRTGVVVRVIAQDNLFRAPATTARVGDTVQFQNVGRNDHDIAPMDGSDDWGVAPEAFVPGDVYEHVFDQPGEYAYYCTIHATDTPGVSPLAAMVGTITVTP